MSEELLKDFAKGILVSDIISYIEAHKKDFELWKKRKYEGKEKEQRGKDKGTN